MAYTFFFFLICDKGHSSSVIFYSYFCYLPDFGYDEIIELFLARRYYHIASRREDVCNFLWNQSDRRYVQLIVCSSFLFNFVKRVGTFVALFMVFTIIFDRRLQLMHATSMCNQMERRKIGPFFPKLTFSLDYFQTKLDGNFGKHIRSIYSNVWYSANYNVSIYINTHTLF